MTTLAEALQTALGHHQAGRLTEAAQIYRQILQAEPRQAEAMHLLGVVEHQSGQHDAAIELITKAIEIDPQLAPAYVNLALAHEALGRVKSAEGDWPWAAACYQRALALNPQFAAAEAQLGIALHAQERIDEAIVHYRRALQLHGGDLETQVNLAAALERRDGQVEAAQLYRGVLQCDPAHPRALLKLDAMLRQRGEFSEVAARYDSALERKPGVPVFHFNRALVLLAAGEFTRGWEGYEWRTEVFKSPSDVLHQPTWDGSDLNGASLLIHGEQGLGDALQFVRYVRLVERRGIEPMLTVRDRLVPILKQSGYPNVVGFSDPLPRCDFKISLLSLPRVFGTTLSTIPAEIPYLAAKADLIDAWRERLRDVAGFRVGICWQGSASNPGDALRSIPLAALEPLARVPGVRLISLQKYDGLDQLRDLAGRFSVVDLNRDLDEEAGLFMDTAAVIQHLDLVITADTAVAHLAGALGVRTWVALAALADWRWLHARKDSPWYPTLRLFRQATPGDWPELFARMATQLSEALANKASRPGK